jgi:hypothetical protein
MAIISRINGPMLESNLTRLGIDLAFETDLLYLDVNNGRIGIRNTMPTVALDVNGAALIGSNLKITGANLSSIVTDGNIDLTPNGAGVVNLSTSLYVTSNANIGNVTIRGAANITGNISGNNITASTAVYSPKLINGTSNLAVNYDGNVNVSVGGTANVLTVTSTGANISGNANITGNANVGNIGATDAILTGNIKVGGDNIKSSTGNTAISFSDKDVTVWGNLDIKGTVTVIESTTTTVNDLNVMLGNNASSSAALDGGGIDLGNNSLVTWRYNHTTTSWQSNVGITPTSNGTLSLGGTSNYWGNAYLTNLFTAANANVANLNATNVDATNISGTLTSSSQPNITSVGNLYNLNVDTEANVGNLYSAGIIQAIGNIDGGNITVDGFGNIGDIRIANNTVTTTVSNGNLELNASGSGTVVLNSDNNAANVAINGISANVFYVDGPHDRIGIMTSTIPAGVTLKIATDSSVILPTGNTSARPGTPLQAMFRFNTDTLNYEFYDGSSWKQASSVFTTISADEYTGDGSQATFTLSQASTTNGTLVAVDGNVQVPSLAYTVSSTIVTFQPGFIPAYGAKVDLRVLTTTTSVNSLSEGDTSIGISDSGSNGTITLATDNAPKLIANAYINANTALVSVIPNVSVGATTVVVDSFSMSRFRSAKYLLQVSNTGRGDYETSEYIALHNGTAAFGTNYAVVYSNVELGSVSVGVNSGNVEVSYTGNFAGNNVKLFKEYIAL